MSRIGSKPRYPPLPPEEREERSGAFSPGGRLLQVEYARDCPDSGPLAVAMKFQGGVLLAKGRPWKTELGFQVPLIWKVNSNMAYVANGNLGDMFYLFDCLARKRPLSSVKIESAVRETLHDHAVRTDVRPLALLLLLGTLEAGHPRLVGFDVTGSHSNATRGRSGTVTFVREIVCEGAGNRASSRAKQTASSLESMARPRTNGSR